MWGKQDMRVYACETEREEGSLSALPSPKAPNQLSYSAQWGEL